MYIPSKAVTGSPQDSDCSAYNNNDSCQRLLQVCHDSEAVNASADIVMEKV